MSPDFLDELAAPTPDPGGGAASAVMVALAAALASMVVAYSPAVDAVEPALATRVHGSRVRARALVAADGAASAAFATALRLPEATPTQRAARDEAVLAACMGAAESALVVADEAAGLLPELRTLDRWGEPRVHADVRVAAAAVGAALRASAANVQTNVEHAQGAGAPAATLVSVLRRLAGLGDQIEVADALAARSVRTPAS